MDKYYFFNDFIILITFHSFLFDDPIKNNATQIATNRTLRAFECLKH